MGDSDVLIVVDVQNGFVNEKSGHIVDDLIAFAKQWKADGGRVIATRFVNLPDSQWRRLLHWDRLAGSPEIELVPGLAGAVTHVVDKAAYTSLVSEVTVLLPQPHTTVSICGIDTDVCVLNTAVDLFERGIVR